MQDESKLLQEQSNTTEYKEAVMPAATTPERAKSIRQMSRASVLGRTVIGGAVGALSGLVGAAALARFGGLEKLQNVTARIINAIANIPQEEQHDFAKTLSAKPTRVVEQLNKRFPTLQSVINEDVVKQGPEIAFTSVVSTLAGAFIGYQSARSHNARADDLRKWGMVERQQGVADARWQETKSFQERAERKLDALSSGGRSL